MFAIILSVVPTAPYVTAWWNFGLETKEMNVVNVRGETRVGFGREHSSLVNITLIAVYPKAAVEARSDMFVMHLAFLVILDPNITEFICDDIEVTFRSLNLTYEYYGLKALSFSSGTLVDFYRINSEGNIAPFSTNVSMAIHPGFWPPFRQDVSHLLYLTDRIETFPRVRLSGRIHYINNTGSPISVFFNMTKNVTSIYRFNFPLTLWIAYGSSLFILIAVSVNLLYHHGLKKKDDK